mgnify:CR=1 FL=1
MVVFGAKRLMGVDERSNLVHDIMAGMTGWGNRIEYVRIFKYDDEKSECPLVDEKK